MPKTKSGKKITYRDQQIPCSVAGCGRTFKSPQGLSGHLQFFHGQPSDSRADGLPSSYLLGEVGDIPPASRPASVKDLKKDVERLELEQRRARLMAGHSEPVKPLDIGEQIGLGSLSPAVQTALQSRAFNAVQPQQSEQDSTLKVLEVIGKVKGLFAGNNNSGLGILKELGFSSLRELIDSTKSPRAGADFNIGGVPLGGASLSPAVIIELLKYQTAKEKAQADAQVSKTYQEQIASFLTLLAKDDNFQKVFARIGADLAGGLRGPGAISAEQGGDDMLGKDIASVGGIPKRRKSRKQAEPEHQYIRCVNESCQQLLNIDGLAVGSELTCPSCGTAQELVFPDEPLSPILEPSDAEKKEMLDQHSKVWGEGQWVNKYGGYE